MEETWVFSIQDMRGKWLNIDMGRGSNLKVCAAHSNTVREVLDCLTNFSIQVYERVMYMYL